MVHVLLRTNLLKLQVEIVVLLANRVEGFPLNYVLINVTGWTCYSTYTTLGYFTTIKGAGTVVLFDFVFVCHAMLMVAIGCIQCCIY